MIELLVGLSILALVLGIFALYIWLMYVLLYGAKNKTVTRAVRLLWLAAFIAVICTISYNLGQSIV